jgi:RNA polymerase primary sigma factor
MNERVELDLDSIPAKHNTLCDARNGERQDIIFAALRTLPDRRAFAVIVRFGLVDDFPRTWEEIGRMLNVTRERARQIEASGMRQLRHPTRAELLKPLFIESVEDKHLSRDKKF